MQLALFSAAATATTPATIAPPAWRPPGPGAWAQVTREWWVRRLGGPVNLQIRATGAGTFEGFLERSLGDRLALVHANNYERARTLLEAVAPAHGAGRIS